MKLAFIFFLKASQPWWVTAQGMGIQSAPSKGDTSCLFLHVHPHYFKSLCSLQPQSLSPAACCPCVTDLPHQRSHLRCAGGSGTLLDPMLPAARPPLPVVSFHCEFPRASTQIWLLPACWEKCPGLVISGLFLMFFLIGPHAACLLTDKLWLLFLGSHKWCWKSQ